MAVNLQSDVMYLTGVGPKRAELLKKELNIHTLKDLLYYFPFKYVDRSKFYKISEINAELPYIQVIGHVVRFQEVGGGRSKRLTAQFTDGTGNIELVWFKGIKWIASSIKPNVKYVVFGKPTLFNGRYNIAHPEVEDYNTETVNSSGMLQPAYNTTEKLKNSYINSKTILKLQHNLQVMLDGKIDESLPAYLLDQLKLMTLPEALRNTHFPQSATLLRKAQARLKFEELFYVQLNLLHQRSVRMMKVNGHVFSVVGDVFNQFYKENLPFELTSAQKRVVREIRKDMGSGKQMNRLLQGDVGSGKTLVAFMSMLIAIDNGYQTCIMAPTEILANQHFETISQFVDGLPLKVGLLTGSTKRSERSNLHSMLEDGTMNIIIGTHALIEDVVQFKNLGLVVIDEQQRFGVAQRAKLWEKNIDPPHVLIMTATPIPRTLAMTVYGDLDVSVIDEMPPGRKPVETLHFTDAKRNLVYGKMREQIAQGRQVYIVYPLIKESEKMDYKDLMDGYDTITRYFPPPQYTTVVVHGKMKPDEKDASMQLFASGKAQILMATTVIEVGVNVPNATVMVIESAERFGLSQLHQLRGRVGRGADKSYCLLISGIKLTNESRKRLQTMVSTNDGFEIAEVDMQIRGPGDMEGTQQSGLPFDLKIASLSHDGQILQHARRVATDIIEEDKTLSLAKNQILKAQLELNSIAKTDFSQIS
ncbi:MAG TPA: ATP-dependent DNA helicase RecG [Tenuifilaceae bacterium]|nr:ATP-dependent DNA helicase RecG [Tenuifilaceae bacterium]HPE17300.1 ATP-dependent DNA helicase RecG [Tenuifilaceae bacterium]HPJ44526.1 ATP-dependent DNA helicase RecG [Tenuifilaceae bacterium]HPQ33064.1 ATP-dependent DNA helicase RecG [Tenuifilaceae bacterium]HRX67608.1 ATP-dependent DNA helicase RecG [Tenuifilaceae bacterium]